MDNTDVQRFLEKTENKKTPLISLNNNKMDENNCPINDYDYDYSLDEEFDVIRSIN